MTEQITALQKTIDTAIEFCVTYSFQIVGAFIILIIGNLIAKWVSSIVFTLCEKKKLDITLSKFIASSVKIVVIIFALIIALAKFGITIAPFVAALGAAAFGATYAIQGPLSNYGAGLSIILGRPFVVGNTVTVAGVSGIVEEVKLACTILTNEDGIRITIPNKHIVGEILYNSAANKVAEGVIGISYDSDPDSAILLIQQTLSQFKEIVSQPAPQVGIQQFADSSVNIGFRYWVPTVKYFQISFAVNRAVYKALKKGNINIPFPQREVRILNQPANV